MASAVARSLRPASTKLADWFAKRPELTENAPEDFAGVKAKFPAVKGIVEKIERTIAEIDTHPKSFSALVTEGEAEPDWEALRDQVEPVLPGFADSFKSLYVQAQSNKALENDFEEDWIQYRKPVEDELVHVFSDAEALDKTLGNVIEGLNKRLSQLETEAEALRNAFTDDILVEYPELEKQIEKEIYEHQYKN